MLDSNQDSLLLGRNRKVAEHFPRIKYLSADIPSAERRANCGRAGATLNAEQMDVPID